MSFTLVCLVLITGFTLDRVNAHPISRSSFPDDFIFGAGSASYQIEGAANVDGKGPSNWDHHTHKNPKIVQDGSNGDIADDFYHRYKEDVKLMKDMGLDYFRFSISWSRLLPKGKKAGGINQLGIKFYNNLINELIANGIQPFVTLYHWDLPQALEDEYGGFLSPNVVSDFVDYADICFKEFGDRVKNWVTINEPNVHAIFAYAKGIHVPNRCTRMNGSFPCDAGNSGTEPYLVGHHLLLSHAYAVNLYKQKYQACQKGKIGISVGCDWVEPYDERPSSKEAAERYYEHFCGWMFNPITYGDYPKTMRSLIGHRLPRFTKAQSGMLRKSFDFFGLNSYSANYAFDQTPTLQHYDQDAHANLTFWDKNGRTIGKPTPVEWIYAYPKGIEKLVLLLKEKYENPVIIVTENGYCTKDETNKTYSVDEYLKDSSRIDYLQAHLSHLHEAIKYGANVKGYFVWSFLDVLEWGFGYLNKCGLIYVDRKDGLKRHMKASGLWYKNILHGMLKPKISKTEF